MAVLCDYDGTASPDITVDLLYQRFAAPSWVEVTQRWERGGISTREELLTNFPTIRAGRAELEAFLDSLAIDPGVPGLLAFCRQHGYAFAIVSDGLTWYIEHVLRRHGLEGLTVYSNEVRFDPDGIHLSFPWYDPECPLRGVCKAAIVRRYQSQGYRVAFIGDGASDREVMGVADVLYAKSTLLAMCREQGVAAIPYTTLDDVITRWREP